MSKIKTGTLTARTDSGTLVIGANNPSHTTRFEGEVILPGYVTDTNLAALLEGWESLYNYITRDEFKQNSNKVFIQKDEPPTIDPEDRYEFNPRVGDIWFDENYDNPMLFTEKGGVKAWRKPQFAQDIDDLKVDVLEIAGELEAVIRTTEKGNWKTKVGDPSADPVVNGEVMFSSVVFTDPSFTIKMSVNDIDGKTHNFTGVNPGQTYIEFVQDDSDYLLFKVSSINLDEPGVVIMEGTGEIGKGVGSDGELNEVRAFEADADVDVSNLMPKSGGTFTGDVEWAASDIIFKPLSPDHLWMNYKSNTPKNADGNSVAGTPWGFNFDIGSANTYRNRFKISNGSTELLTVEGGSTGKVNLNREAHYLTNPKSTYADKEIPHWKGIKDWATDQFQAKGSYATATEKLGSGHERYYNYVSPRSLGEHQFSCSSTNVTSVSYVYFYKLYDYYNRAVTVKNFYRTADTMLEVWEQSTGNMVMKFGVKEYGASSYSSSDVYFSTHRIWAKPSYYMSSDKLYCILLTNMVRK